MQSSRPIKQGQLQDFISNSTQAALNLKANILNPSFSGTVKLLSNVPNGLLTINGVNSIISLSGTTNLLTKWNSSGTLSNSIITDTGAAISIAGNLTATNIIRSGGAATEYLMANGTVSTIATNISGTANYLPKFTSANVIGNSRITDDGTYLGIGSISPIPLSKDIQLGRQANKEIGIEQSDSTKIGRDLILTAGRTINFQETSNFISLNQTTRVWQAISVNNTTGDVYAIVYNGDIYKQTNGEGNFIALGQTIRPYTSMTVAPNGDIYATVYNGDIYKITGGIGSFTALGQGNKVWSSIDAAPNGDIYATEGYDAPAGVGNNGDIYKQTGGVGNFIALGQTLRLWTSIGFATNGDIYASVYNGDIYKQTGGVGNFTGLTQTTRYWSSIAGAPNGDVYATEGRNNGSGDVYKQTAGVGNFVALGQTLRQWNDIYFANNSIGYGAAGAPFGDNLYILTTTIGIANLQGGALKLKAGTGKGTGQSRVQIITGQITTSGTNMQTEQVVAQFDESGNTTFNGLIIKSGGTSNQFLMADGSLSTSLISGNTITGITYTLVNSDHSKQLQTTNSGAITIIIPTGLTNGFACEIIQEGLGQVSISGMSGTTVRYSSFEFPTTFEQYSVIGIESITNLTDNYRLFGQLTSI